MRFAEPLALILLLLAPITLLLHLAQERRRAAAEAAAGDLPLVRALVLLGPDGGKGARLSSALLLALGLALSAVALARPQFGLRTLERKARGIDLVVALDLSRSMLARDVVPSRLERAQIELGTLMRELRGDRIGLVGFTSVALPLSPLTVDHRALELQLKSANPSDLPRGGTTIAEAISQATRMLETAKASGAARAILVLTDGEDNDGDAVAAAKKARASGYEVHVVGVGSRTGEPIPLYGDDGKISGYLKDRGGQTVVSRLNEDLLRQVAEAGGGLVSLPGPSGELDLTAVRQHLGTLKRADLDKRSVRVYEERYQLVLVPAFLALLASALLTPRRRGLAISLLLLLGWAAPARAEDAPFLREDPDARQGNEHLVAGRTKEALEAYQRAERRARGSAELAYDRGLAQAQAGELDKAMTELKAAMEGSDRAELRGQAAYALGNAYRRLQRYDDAIGAYKRALLEDPRLTGARRNLQIAQRQKVVAEAQPRDKKQNQDGDKPPEQGDAGVSPDGGPSDGGDDKADAGGASSADAGGADGGPGGSPDGSGGGKDAGGGSAGAADAGPSQDAGAGAESPPAEQGESEKEADRMEAEQILDSLLDQEKALKRKRLLEKITPKKVEKDW